MSFPIQSSLYLRPTVIGSSPLIALSASTMSGLIGLGRQIGVGDEGDEFANQGLEAKRLFERSPVSAPNDCVSQSVLRARD